MSSFTHLDSKDFWEGFGVTIAVAVLQALKEGLTGDGLNFTAYDWQAILNVALNAGRRLRRGHVRHDEGRQAPRSRADQARITLAWH
jgi:hypothetical protein